MLVALRTVCHDGEARIPWLLEALGRSHSKPSGGSRQARHSRARRALTTALAAITVLGLEREEYAWVFCAPDFAYLHGNSAGVHVRIGELLMARRNPPPTWASQCWARQSESFKALVRELPYLDRQGLLVLRSSLAPLFCCAIAMGPALGAEWQALYADVQAPLEASPFLRLHLATVGAFAGQPAALTEALLRPGLRPWVLAGGLCLVRDDLSDELFDSIGVAMRDAPLDPECCLHPLRPWTTVMRLAEYVRSCMRNPMHFCNEALALNLLAWHHEAGRLLEKHARDWAEHLPRVRAELNRLEQVQLLEKTRFWHVHDTAPEGETRALLHALWNA